jgi:hypothetical protein
LVGEGRRALLVYDGDMLVLVMMMMMWYNTSQDLWQWRR